ETYRLTERVNPEKSNLPDISSTSDNKDFPDLRYVNQKQHDLREPANRSNLGLHKDEVNPDNLGLQPSVKQHYVGSATYVNRETVDLHNDKSEESGKNVNELDTLIQQLKQQNVSKRSS